jgi:hypothetical protein
MNSRDDNRVTACSWIPNICRQTMVRASTKSEFVCVVECFLRIGNGTATAVPAVVKTYPISSLGFLGLRAIGIELAWRRMNQRESQSSRCARRPSSADLSDQLVDQQRAQTGNPPIRDDGLDVERLGDAMLSRNCRRDADSYPASRRNPSSPAAQFVRRARLFPLRARSAEADTTDRRQVAGNQCPHIAVILRHPQVTCGRTHREPHAGAVYV